jgi:hypothetical protein
MKHLFEQGCKPLKLQPGNRLYGVLYIWDQVNKNQRTYPRREAWRVFKALEARLEAKEAIVGALDHPANDANSGLQGLSHKLESIEWNEKGRCVKGCIRLLNTTAGKDALELLHQKVPIGVSTRGTGTLNRKGNVLEVTDWELETFDLVSNPSSNRFMELMESAINRNLDFSFDAWLQRMLFEQAIANESVSQRDIDRLLRG